MQRKSVMYKIWKLFILLCLCSTVSFPVRGEVSRAKKHYLEGENYVIGGKYRKALAEFRERNWGQVFNFKYFLDQFLKI